MALLDEKGKAIWAKDLVGEYLFAPTTAGDLDGIPVWIISSEALIRNKRATGRTRDLADAEMLERLRDR